jgi:hypothetical protein
MMKSLVFAMAGSRHCPVGGNWDTSDLRKENPEKYAALALRDHGIDAEYDDDAILSLSKHLIKFGSQFELLRERFRCVNNFNGTWLFGGGTAPVLDANNPENVASRYRDRRDDVKGISAKLLRIAMDNRLRIASPAIYSDKTDRNSTDFLTGAVDWFDQLGIGIRRVLSENGSCYRANLLAR